MVEFKDYPDGLKLEFSIKDWNKDESLRNMFDVDTKRKLLAAACGYEDFESLQQAIKKHVG